MNVNLGLTEDPNVRRESDATAEETRHDLFSQPDVQQWLTSHTHPSASSEEHQEQPSQYVRARCLHVAYMPSSPTGAQGMLKHSPQTMDMNITAEAPGRACLRTSATKLQTHVNEIQH
jgi:hypothetical protein